jgi:DNA-binding transcriptional ArsR family regulator
MSTLPDDVVQISDSRVLAAMAHELRRRLLTLLKLEGPSTVSLLAARTGQASGNISHHLRVLAAAGLVEEAPELARDRRERWWRRAVLTTQWSMSDFAGDAAAEAVARAADSLNLDYQLSRVREWAGASDEEKARWPHGPFSVDTWLKLTDEELAQLGAEMIALLRRWADREVPDDRQERGTVFAFARALPASP